MPRLATGKARTGLPPLINPVFFRDKWPQKRGAIRPPGLAVVAPDRHCHDLGFHPRFGCQIREKCLREIVHRNRVIPPEASEEPIGELKEALEC